MSQEFIQQAAALRRQIAQSEEELRGFEQKRAQVDEQIAKLTAARETITAAIDERADALDDLQYSLNNTMAQEQRRQNNWVVEREADEPPPRHQVMPWARGTEEDQRFRRTLLSSMAASVALAAIISSIAIPFVERTEPPELPERIVKLVLEQQMPVPQTEQEELPTIEPEPLPEPKALPEPEPEPQQAQRTPDPKPRRAAPTKQPTVAQAAPTPAPAKPKGILAFRDRIANKAEARPAVALGAQAKLSTAGANEVGRTSRAMVTTNAPGSSGGINLASISRDVGGGGGGGGAAMQGVSAGRVASSIGGGGASDRPLSGGGNAGRSDEEIQIVFDRNKAGLYRLYNRELRKDPTLRGQLVLRLTIEPDGSVSMCALQSSDMNAPALTQQIVNRVRSFDFGAKPDIVAMTIIYPIDFLPAA